VGEMGNNSVLTDFLSRIGLDILADVLGLDKIIDSLAVIVKSILYAVFWVVLCVVVYNLVVCGLLVIGGEIIHIFYPTFKSIFPDYNPAIKGILPFTSITLDFFSFGTIDKWFHEHDPDSALGLVLMSLFFGLTVSAFIIGFIFDYYVENIKHNKYRPINQDQKNIFVKNSQIWRCLAELKYEYNIAGCRLVEPHYSSLTELRKDSARDLVDVLNELEVEQVDLNNLKLIGAGVGQELTRLQCDVLHLRGLNCVSEENLYYLSLLSCIIDCKRHLRKLIEKTRHELLKE